MKIESLAVGELQANCYVLTENGEAIVIDPGDECDKILALTEKRSCKVTKILLTHGHFDHIGAVAEMAEKTGAKVYVHRADAEMLTDNTKNLSEMTGVQIKPYTPDGFLEDNALINFGEEVIKVHHTPGHSGGGVCFVCGKSLFCGDLLFSGSIGRFDRGDLRTELNSLKFLMDNFSDDTVVYPGHGPFTTIGDERNFNPYIVNHVN